MFPNVNFVLILSSAATCLKQPLFVLLLGGGYTQVWLYCHILSYWMQLARTLTSKFKDVILLLCHASEVSLSCFHVCLFLYKWYQSNLFNMRALCNTIVTFYIKRYSKIHFYGTNRDNENMFFIPGVPYDV